MVRALRRSRKREPGIRSRFGSVPICARITHLDNMILASTAYSTMK